MANKDTLSNYMREVLQSELPLEDVSDDQLGLVIQSLIKGAELTALSPLDGRYASDVEALEATGSERALIATRTEIEARYLIALSEIGVVRELTDDEKAFLMDLGPNLGIAEGLRVKKYEEKSHHDVNAMTLNLRERLKGTSLEKDATEMVHFGLTSEDVNNISYRLNLARAVESVMVPALDEVILWLAERAEEFKALPMRARTHGQAAIPTTLGKELVVFAMRLEKEMEQLKKIKLTGKLNGAVGNHTAANLAYPEIDWVGFEEDFIDSLGLEPNVYTTQINPYEDMITVFQDLLRMNGILLDLDQDMWRYISDGWLVQEVKAGEVGSSTMPQKVNPIRYENSEGNIAVADALLPMFASKLAVSRLQRDLSDTTVVRNVGSALGYTLLALKGTLAGLKSVKPNPELIHNVLNQDWAILTEAAQTLMRQANVPDAYDKVKALARGMHIDKNQWIDWVDGLDVKEDVRKQLQALTPETYLGEAVRLTSRGVEEIRKVRK